jgi:hypothetical protein
MNYRPSFGRTLFASSMALWVAACGDDSTQPSMDAAADGAKDGTSSDVNSQDVRRETTTLPPMEGGAVVNDGGCTPVAATCDGPEDCPMGQTCCGTLDMTVGGYTKIACQPSPCAPADAGMAGLGGGTLMFELCRADTMCHDTMGYTCGTSMYLPPFLYRCYMWTSAPPSTATGLPGHVACGNGTCNTGEECCILGQTGMSAPSYCAPVGQGCSCSGMPSSDGGVDAGTDAAPGDAAGEGSSDAPSGDAPADAGLDVNLDALGDVLGDVALDVHE